tara:strand:- start:850 stop:1245 length:396 start_codon:yes stop_codon:yes gene_type:complete
MKTIFIITSLFFMTYPPIVLQAHEISQSEIKNKNIFHAWWEEKDKDCIIRFLPQTSSQEASFQIDEGIPIIKDQFLEVYKEEKYRGAFVSKAYIYHLTYKDENSKVSTSKIIFVNKKSSNAFEEALENFGI